MNQQQFWNQKFKRDDFLYGQNPNQFIKDNYYLLKPKSKVLCLGEGEGRNAIFLAKNGFDITAIDASDIGLEKLKNSAIQQNCSVKTECLDLDSWKSMEKYDSIICSYLHLEEPLRQDVFKKVFNSLNIGGYFIAEFFSKSQINYKSGGPRVIELLYTVSDFNNIFPKDSLIYLSEDETILNEGDGHQGLASVIRVICKR